MKTNSIARRLGGLRRTLPTAGLLGMLVVATAPASHGAMSLTLNFTEVSASETQLDWAFDAPLNWFDDTPWTDEGTVVLDSGGSLGNRGFSGIPLDGTQVYVFGFDSINTSLPFDFQPFTPSSGPAFGLTLTGGGRATLRLDENAFDTSDYNQPVSMSGSGTFGVGLSTLLTGDQSGSGVWGPVDVTWTVIPEPSSIALIGLAGACTLLGRRRR